MWRFVLCALAATPLFLAIDRCACDPAQAESLRERACSLTNEAHGQPENIQVFFLKDINPRKPNRYLALPRRIVPGALHEFKDLTAAERTGFWKEAIARARELWGDDWGLAYNGAQARTQCHLHVHIGKLLKGVDRDPAVLVNRPEDIPVPQNGSGMWIHPVGRHLKVHLNEQICETVLLR